MMVLLEAMVRHRVDKIVFSSTASVYGEPDAVPIPKPQPCGLQPLWRKQARHGTHDALGGRSSWHPLGNLALFQRGGAWAQGEIGEDHRPESHLIPIILQVPLGKRPHITIFGDDYPTPDGTCIRDYLDVVELADAHMRAVDYLRAGGASEVCNLGNGTGFLCGRW